ncbi:unnamed protein product [Periconia digitata]|uniref:Uncharacterized protein n=1 Tax=Periconia digitata TaxID=1303443 RepID=A0A9W4UAM6_9PLEO|nr:unnamed protein product [Periconia digitata]
MTSRHPDAKANEPYHTQCYALSQPKFLMLCSQAAFGNMNSLGSRWPSTTIRTATSPSKNWWLCD